MPSDNVEPHITLLSQLVMGEQGWGGVGGGK